MRHQDTETGRRPVPAQARLPRPHVPFPSIPRLVDLPPQAEVARQLGELRFVQVLETGDAVGRETVLGLELAMPFDAHELTMLALPVERRVEYYDPA